MAEALRVGLVGAGPWAQVFHAPLIAGAPDLELAGVWARRPEAAQRLAGAHATEAAPTFDDLLASCDAVAFAVPPDVQATLAVTAADRGKHLLLEKPLGLTLDDARAVADVAAANGIVSQLVLTWRYLPMVRSFLDDARHFEAYGARAASISGLSRPGELFATPWRVEHGALLDVGPHVLDVLDAALGPIVDIVATGDPRRWVEVTCRHADGAVSEASLSITTPLPDSTWSCMLYGASGALALEPSPDPDDTAREYASATATIAAELAACVAAGEAHPLDAARGLYLQELITTAASTA